MRPFTSLRMGTSTTCGTANTVAPAASAEATPVGESSIAIQRVISTPRRSAANRYGSGCGLPRSTSSPTTDTSNAPAGNASITSFAKRRHDMVTNAVGISDARTSANNSRAPGRHGTLRLMFDTTLSNIISTISWGVSRTPPCSIMYRPESRRSNPTTARACSSLHESPCAATTAYSASNQYGSVSTMVPSKSHNTACS